MTIGAVLAAGACAIILSLMGAFRAPRCWLSALLASTLTALAAAAWVLATGKTWEWRSAFLIGGESVHLRLDGVSALFLALVAGVGGAGAAYSREYWAERAHPVSAQASRWWWSALLLCMGLLLLCSNGLHFLIAWELFALCAYFLITLDAQRREVRSAGWLYFAASHTGTLALFAFFSLLAARTGSWDLGPMREQAELAPLFWLALFGFGVKAGMFPLHIWLPSAHANAPSHVSAIMSGVAIKMGIYGIVRFSGWLPAPPSAGWVVTALGVVSAVLGVAFALGQHDLKRLLAYHSVENIGIILIGLGFALVAMGQGNAPWGRLALAGGLLHVWNHGLFKSLLFFAAGSVLHATGTREMSRLGGLWRMMPWTASLFALGAGAESCVDSPRGDRRAGARVFCESLRRGVFGRSAFPSGGTRARKRPGDARRDAGAGRGVRGDWPRAGRLLAGGVAGGGCLESGLGRSGDTRCPVIAGNVACGAGSGRAGGGRLALAPRAARRSDARGDVGLWICCPDATDAIHCRLVCWHHHRMVRVDPTTRAA